jgi:hypothetical protein
MDPDFADEPDTRLPFFDLLQEWSEEGHLYLYDEQPEAMHRLETYLETQVSHYDLLYRRTDWAPFMTAEVGDVVVNNRCSSWSQENLYINDMYDGVPSVLLVLENQDLPAVEMAGISSWTIECEALIRVGAFEVLTKSVDPISDSPTLYLKYHHA